MDRITKSLLEDFLKQESLKSKDESEDFEKFSCYCVGSKEYPETFEVNDIWTGGGGDTGLDGVAIIVNGNLVNSTQEVEDLIRTNGYLEAIFVFIQSKTSDNFNGSEIGNFFFGVQDFFSDKPKLTRNEEIINVAEIKDCIYSHSAKLEGTPICKLYYITTGKWVDDKDLQGRISQGTNDLDHTKLFGRVDFLPLGVTEVQKLYRATKTQSSVEINFSSKVTLPDLDGVEESYIGVLPYGEYKKLIIDDVGNIRRSLFYDNIRDFQGENVVNRQIAATLKSEPRNAKKFVILNNGITIVAKSLKTVGNKFTLNDYQIVNGCQTSHVLWESQNTIADDVLIPVKIIGTTDEDVITSVTKSTNTQNPVKAEDLAAMSEFQKKLESYFSTFTGDKKLYYERRSKQYNAIPEVEKVRIVSIPTEIRVFASMFLDLPHQAGGYYGTLMKSVGDKIFFENHQLEPYYTSAFAYYKIESLIRSKTIDFKYRKFRYHLLMVMRRQIAGTDLPQFNARKMQPYCSKIDDVLWDASKFTEACLKAIKVLDDARINLADRDVVKTQAFTEKILKLI